jgi:hypothetical protein
MRCGRKVQLRGSLMLIIKQENNCKHWACDASTKRCVGCGTIICPACLQEPVHCTCENKETCCEINN